MARELGGWGGPSDDPGKESGQNRALGNQSFRCSPALRKFQPDVRELVGSPQWQECPAVSAALTQWLGAARGNEGLGTSRLWVPSTAAGPGCHGPSLQLGTRAAQF